MLSIYLKKNGYTVLQIADNVNTMIVNEVILKAKNESEFIVVEEYIYLTVQLVDLSPEAKTIIFLKSGKGNNKKHIYFTREAQKMNGIKQSILFLHAISDCNIVSCFLMLENLNIFYY